MLRASYKIVDLQNRLGMDASNVPNLTIVRVTPAENLEVTNILLAEMTRIKAHLDIDLPHETRPRPAEQKTDRRVRSDSPHSQKPGPAD